MSVALKTVPHIFRHLMLLACDVEDGLLPQPCIQREVTVVDGVVPCGVGSHVAGGKPRMIGTACRTRVCNDTDPPQLNLGLAEPDVSLFDELRAILLTERNLEPWRRGSDILAEDSVTVVNVCSDCDESPTLVSDSVCSLVWLLPSCSSDLDVATRTWLDKQHFGTQGQLQRDPEEC